MAQQLCIRKRDPLAVIRRTAFDVEDKPVEWRIPFGGAGETLQNFLDGHVDIYGGSISTVLPNVENE